MLGDLQASMGLYIINFIYHMFTLPYCLVYLMQGSNEQCFITLKNMVPLAFVYICVFRSQVGGSACKEETDPLFFAHFFLPLHCWTAVMLCCFCMIDVIFF